MGNGYPHGYCIQFIQGEFELGHRVNQITFKALHFRECKYWNLFRFHSWMIFLVKSVKQRMDYLDNHLPEIP